MPGAARRVALISSSFAPYVGGVETHVDRVAHALRDTGWTAEVWTVDRGEGLGVVEQDGVRVRYLPTPLPARSAGAMMRFARQGPPARRAWADAYREFRPAVLNIQCFGPNGLYAEALARRVGAPLVVTSHGETLADDRGVFHRSRRMRAGLRRAIAAAAAVTAPSQYVLDDLRRAYGLAPAEGRIVRNGVDPIPLGEPMQLPAGRYVLGVGRLGRMKGFDLLIEAFADAGLDPGVELVIGGDGPEAGALEALAAARGVAHRVRLLGRLDPAEVAQLMAGALSVVVPSRAESFGIVALEAWRAATALVMTNRGGAVEFVHDGSDALLVDPLDRQALVEALRRVTADDALRTRLAAAGHARVGEFGWPSVARSYAAVFDELVDADARAEA
ncbi:glycosyltransferase family 4 protein [Microbacterium sp. E-13]|uniref:glycosyltransferase family 4 protein n=1 Tax=Microbacterium sp. E-13 TaxID=3404048 RepID=UPI003CF4BD71